MLGLGVADPAQLAILARAVCDYCARHEIVGADDREQVAIRVMRLFGQGIVDFDQLSVELEKGRLE